MFEKILQGESPTKVFREIIAADPTIGNIRLGQMLCDELLELTGEAKQLIWHWQGPGKAQGLNDSELDALLKQQLRNSGYL